MKIANIFINSFIGTVAALVNGYALKKGDYVIVDSDKGLFLGQVVSFRKEKDIKNNDYKIVRLATNSDKMQSLKNGKEADGALKEIKKISDKLSLEMSFVEAVFSLDRKRLYFSFISDSRVDFRELAKRLAQKYHTRIELRQIGVRDKAKKIGGIGPCGLLLCCNSFLSDFNSVSINMAKNQLLALNPSKINGSCGRLMCCLNYENDVYKEERKNLPKIGNIIQTKEGTGKVIDLDVFKKICKIELPNKTIVSVKVGDIDGKIG